MTIRQQIVDALTLKFKNVPGIVTATPWRKSPFIAAECPALYLADAEDRIESVVIGLHDHHLTVACWLFLRRDLAGGTVRELMAGIMAAVGADDTLGGLAIIVRPLSATTNLLQQGDIISAAEITMEVHYRTPRWGI